jgi:hypothetical protein
METVKEKQMTQPRKIGNRRSINVGGLIFHIRDDVGLIKMAAEFYLLNSNTQLNLLDDWINALEEMYNAERKEAGTLQGRMYQRKLQRQLRVVDEDEE